MNERIEKINMDWFLMEPALFKVLCSHQVVANTDMQCPIRSGKRRIEYNPVLCKDMTDLMLREYFKAECIRILLKHPYQRQPQNCSAEATTLGSNCVLADNYKYKEMEILSPADFNLPGNEAFEFYAKKIQEMMPEPPSDVEGSEQEKQGGESNQQQDGGGESDSDQEQNSNGESGSQGGNQKEQDSSQKDDSQEGNNQNGGNNSCGCKQSGNTQENNGHGNSDASQLWQEDAMMEAEVNEMIQMMEASKQWGSISANLAGKIVASTKVKIDYRRVLQLFRTEVLSSKRRLTRMRPNRRSGFENLGSVYRLTSRLLVAVDVSGSTTDEMVSDFFGIINKFFKYGIEDIDVIQFDVHVKGEPMTLKKAKKEGIDIVGRGGTDFQAAIDYADEHRADYQGLLIFTDGYAEPPMLPSYFRMPILWILPSEDMYNEHKKWMKKSGKACFIETR